MLNLSETPEITPFNRTKPVFLEADSVWVDSLMASMTLEEKIGQFFMLPTPSKRDKTGKVKKEILEYIKKYHIGGVILSKGHLYAQTCLLNELQDSSKIPLLTGIDGEWGISMRIDSIVRYPRQMTLGAIQDEDLIFQLGEEFGRECSLIGIHLNFAPVVDINNNPMNPVIGSRAFGEDKMNVTRKGFALSVGMLKHRVIATAKHFPGHGDTETDSHKALPIITHSRERLDSVELFPYKELIDNGLNAVMVGHLHVPSLDPVTNRPATLSPVIINGILRDSLNYKGLVITDALAMKGISRKDTTRNVELEALMAGNDILLIPKELPKAIDAILNAVENNVITEDYINKKCRKILMFKSWLGLANYKPVDPDGLKEKINTEEAEFLKRRLYESTVTLLKNESMIPFMQLEKWNLASIALGEKEINTFQKHLELYTDIETFAISDEASQSVYNALIETLSKYNGVIVSIHDLNHRPKDNFGLSDKTIDFLEKIATKTNVVLDFFGNAYGLTLLKGLENVKTIVLSYDDTDMSQQISAQAIFGGIGIKGRLPVSLGDEFQLGSGMSTERIRLKYSVPMEVEINTGMLHRIDSIVLDAIDKHAMPGCQVLAAKDGVVFYNKAFGYHTYDKNVPVSTSDIYDIASVTKISATLPALMKLTDERKFKVRARMSKYIKALDTTNKKSIVCRDALAHFAKLPGWYPFYNYTYENKYTKTLRKDIYSITQSDSFPLQVAENLFIIPTYEDSIMNFIYKSKLRRKRRYKYSDIAFYLFKDVVETLTKQPIDRYVDKTFYKPLGATTTGYNPLKKFEKSRIIPTEKDDYYRKQLLQGYVHDHGAALLGGVAGHAGLFSNANDLAKIMQLYLQRGEYGGRYYIDKETIELYTKRPYRVKKNRRALGFDRPFPDAGNNGIACKSAPDESFGHTGFTGTMVWVDPINNIVYIFLSNRVHPDMTNRKLIDLNIRSKVQQVIYDAMNNEKLIAMARKRKK